MNSSKVGGIHLELNTNRTARELRVTDQLKIINWGGRLVCPNDKGEVHIQIQLIQVMLTVETLK